MKKRFYDIRLFLTLITFWLLLTMNLKINNIILGIVVSLMIIMISHLVVTDEYESVFKEMRFLRFLEFAFIVIIEIYISSFYHIQKIINNDSEAIILTVNLDTKDPLIVTFIASAITLTPGTITIDVEKENVLKVLAIVRDDDEKQEIKNKIINKYQSSLRGRG